MDDIDDVQREPFGTWLLKQNTSSRWYAALAKAAKADHRFPKAGDPEKVGKHMHAGGGDSEVVEMLEDAERDWMKA